MERRTRRRVDASAADVGRRVTLRYRLDPLGLNHSEAVGVLTRWTGVGDDGILMLRRRDDSTVRIPFGSVEVARVLPPEVSSYRMQEMAERSWPPSQWQDLGTWRMRWSGPNAGRANSARVAGPPDRPLPAALKAVAAWYEERDAQPLIQVPYPSALDEAYDQAGWPIVRRSRLMVFSTQRLYTTTASARERSDMVVSVSDHPDPDWLSLLSGDDVGRQQEIEPILTAPEDVAFVSCRRVESGELLGIGRGVLLGDWAGANNVVTAADARRRGVATAVMAELATWSSERGASRWFLRVFGDSEPALSLYDSLGFTLHHTYVYRAREALDRPDDTDD